METKRESAFGCAMQRRMWPTRRSMRAGERGAGGRAVGFAGLNFFSFFVVVVVVVEGGGSEVGSAGAELLVLAWRFCSML